MMRAPHAVSLAVLLATSVTSTFAAAQSMDSLWISGTVVDSLGRGVSGASVLLRPDGVSVRTDASGFFSLRIAAGPSSLVVRSVGYAPLTADLDLVGGRDRQFRIELSHLPHVLDAVVTEARKPYMPPGAPASMDDFYRRRAEGRGASFTREDIVRIGGIRQALGTLAGVRTEGSGTQGLSAVRMTRCPPERIVWFLDGLRVSTMPELSDEDIEAIEVYTGPSRLPPEAVGNACGAVYVWTRRG
jgi:hypothetical protein